MMTVLVCSKCGHPTNQTLNGLCAACSPELAKVIHAKGLEEVHRRELYWALRTRVLTIEEWREVEQYDFWLCVEPMCSYHHKDKVEEFNASLLQQFKLRMAVETAKAKDS